MLFGLGYNSLSHKVVVGLVISECSGSLQKVVFDEVWMIIVHFQPKKTENVEQLQ